MRRYELADAQWNLIESLLPGKAVVRFRLTVGQRHDRDQAEALIEGFSPGYVVADKSYDSDPLRKVIRRSGAKPAISSRKGIRRRRRDRTSYKFRNRVERFFNRVKHHQRVATRYEKTG